MAIVQREYPKGAIKIINTKTLEDLGDIVGVGDKVHVVELHLTKDGYIQFLEMAMYQK